MEVRIVERLGGRLDAAEDRLKEFVRQSDHDLETKILTEFHKWASPLEMRIRTHSLAIRATDLEIEALGDRVEKLERP